MEFLFVVFSFIALAGALTMILVSQPLYAALSLIVSILALAGLYALLSAPFLFMVQIIVYAGAIIALLLFIVMFLNIKKEDLPQEPHKNRTIILGAIVLIPLNILVIKGFLSLPHLNMPETAQGFGSIKEFGMELFTRWLVPFELISLLILAALLGAIVYARKEKSDG